MKGKASAGCKYEASCVQLIRGHCALAATQSCFEGPLATGTSESAKVGTETNELGVCFTPVHSNHDRELAFRVRILLSATCLKYLRVEAGEIAPRIEIVRDLDSFQESSRLVTINT